RYSGETDVPVGSVVGNRSRSEVQRVIGFFANNIVLRGDLSGDPTVRELIARTRDVALKAFAHQEMPFDILVDAMTTRRALDHSPLFQVNFVLQNLHRLGFEVPGLSFEPIELPVRTARFDMSVDVFDLSMGLRVYCEYNTDLFDAATIERAMSHYRSLLEGFVVNPDARVDELPMLADAELRRLLVEWNATAAQYPREQTVHGLFEAQAMRVPEAEAVRFGGQSLSYAQLNERSNRLARHLRELGVGAESLVGVWMERSAD